MIGLAVYGRDFIQLGSDASRVTASIEPLASLIRLSIISSLQCRRLVPPRYSPEGDSPLSLYATVLSSRVVLPSVSRHRAGVRAAVPAVQVRGECPYGACRSSQQARLGPR